jgi:hypothetical protein
MIIIMNVVIIRIIKNITLGNKRMKTFWNNCSMST